MTIHFSEDNFVMTKCRHLSSSDTPALAAFYLTLPLAARRTRFGAGRSNASIVDYCQTLDWMHTIVIGSENTGSIEAVAEIHPFTPGGSIAELAIVCHPIAVRTHTIAHLLQISSFAAAAKNVRTLVVLMNEPQPELLSQLRVMADVVVKDDHAFIDIADFGASGLGKS